jgi:transcription elongation factor GreA
VGSTVLLKDQDTGDDIEYTIVGSAEADPADNKISNESPVGKAILGKKVDTVVEIKVPAGILKYRIVDIRAKS